MHNRWARAFGRVAIFLAILVAVRIALPAPAAARNASQNPDDANVWRDRPATPQRMIERLEAAAEKYEAYAPIPRAVFYDIGYPRSNDEYNRLAGYAVLLITAVSQERAEFPVTRVYVQDGSTQIELKLISAVVSKSSGVSDRVEKTFGGYRSDGLYLLPVYLRLKPAELLVDFAKNKRGLEAATFGTQVSAEVAALKAKPVAGASPPDEVLQAFIRREFPGFIE